MIAVLKRNGRIVETRERWRSKQSGVNEEEIVSKGPTDQLHDPSDAPRRKDGSLRPRRSNSLVPGIN